MNTLMCIAAMFCAHAAAGLDALPGPDQNLHYETPVHRWDEAFPLGNGLLGALVWDDGTPLTISLDRTDLWDLRPVPEFHTPEYDWATMQAWEAAERYDDLQALYEAPYHRPGPTKIPAGRLQLDIGKGLTYAYGALDLATATTHVRFEEGADAMVYIHATEPLGIVRVAGAEHVAPRLVAPAFGGKEPGEPKPAISAGELSELGYPPPERSEGGNWAAYTQQGWGGFQFAVYAAWRENDGVWTGVWSVASSREGLDPLDRARKRVDMALDGRLDSLRESHLAWWRAYWDASRVAVPDDLVEQQYYLDMYKFGAASRRGAPPITLQGPWTADKGRIPPWKGDYHHDLNTELSYWPAYAGNHLDEGLAFTDWLWKTRHNAAAWTRRFFDMPGLNVPMTADLENQQIGGWRQYTHSPTIACWLAHHFYLHWQFSGDRAFLAQQAYPWLRDVAVFIEAVSVKGEDGTRVLPLSSSPEIHDNKPEAWFKDTLTNYDLALIRWLLAAAAELAVDLERSDDAAKWRALLDEFPDFALGDDGRLLVAPGEPLEASHRHFSHLMAIHPLGVIDVADGDDAARTVKASLADLERLGTKMWTGYSFAWWASLAARAYDGETAAKALHTFAEAFVLRNSFHVNGDQSGQGYSNFTYRPFTLEGNFASAAGLQEMLLQSHRGMIEVFPAVPEDWEDIAFERLRARGAVLVSAEMRGGKVQRVTLERTANTPDKEFTIRLPGGATHTVTLDESERFTLSVPE